MEYILYEIFRMASLQRQKTDHRSPGTRAAANGELLLKGYSISARDDEKFGNRKC